MTTTRSSLPAYLINREGSYYFRRRVPAKLVPIIGRRFWQQTLETRDETPARKLANRLNADCEAAISVAKEEYRRQRSAVARLTRDERAVVEAAGGLKALRSKTLGTLKTDVRFAEASAGVAASLLTRGLRDEPIPEALASMHAVDVATDRRDADDVLDLDALQQELAEAEARATALRSRFERNLTILRKGAEDADDPELASDVPPAATLQTVLDRWAEESKAPEQHVQQYQYAIRRFHERHGPLALTDITREHLRAFRTAILKLPRSTRADIRSATLAQAVSIADKESLPRIEPRTADKHMTAIGTLLSHAVGYDLLNASPAVGLKVVKARTKKAATDDRIGFTPAQVRAIDKALGDTYAADSDDRWIPIVCAFQGCRQEEACQLMKTDVYQQTGGLWVMRVTDSGEGQTVKNKASVRTVPIHPMLIDRGFLDHVSRSPGPRIFASLKPDQRGRLGGPYGKRFARLLRKKIKITDPRLTFHSLRHAWATAAHNVLVPLAVKDAIIGHQHGGPIEALYGDVADPVVLAPWLNKVNPFADPGAPVAP